MTTKKKATKKPRKQKLPLLEALEFVKKAQKTGGDATQTHVRLMNGVMTAFDHVLACGYPIIEDQLNVVAHTKTLEKILKNFKEGDSLTQHDPITLTVKSGETNAQIPCINPAAIDPCAPDADYCATDAKELKECFADLAKFIKKGADTIVASSLMLTEQSVYATDLELVVERWHGQSLPIQTALPQSFVAAVKATKLELRSIGYGEKRLTFKFDGGAWIRTQVYEEGWPMEQIISVFANAVQPKPLPNGFFAGIKEILPFTEDGYVWLTKEGITNGPPGAYTAQHPMDGLPDRVCINGEKISHLRNLVTTATLDDGKGITHFYGEKTRAAISQKQ